MIGPITKNAILGVIFGVVALPIWAALTRQIPLPASVLVGFAGGLTGGLVWGVWTRRLRSSS
jgi:membrane protease YdiL (CAAX protease family)